MSNRKVLLFGSFTEDETRSFQQQYTSAKIKFQFGSFDYATVSSLGAFKAQPKDDGSRHRPEVDQQSNLVKKDDKLKEKEGDDLHIFPGKERSNGNPEDSSSCVPLSNGISERVGTDVNLSSLSISEDKSELARSLASSEVQGSSVGKTGDKDVPTIVNQNEICSDSSDVVVARQDLHKAELELTVETLTGKNLLPRGLNNSGNLCFLNATLQALLSCSPFVKLLQKLRIRNIPKVGYPTLHAFVEFISEFDMPSGQTLKKNEVVVLETGIPFNPIMFDPVLKNFTPDVPAGMSGQPRQEDAQEFLSFLMDQMHDELLKLDGRSGMNGNKFSLISSADEDDWETVGPKNKSAVTRIQTFMPSELSEIFGGQLRSVVKARGNKASATVQPFLLLHLDIFSDAIDHIYTALHLFSAPEALEGYRASAGKAGVVSASKSVKIQTLSKILILHLMRFSFGSKGSTKLHKPVEFPLELQIGRELLVSPSSEGRKYELVATITHHGREPSKGHYTAHVKYYDGQWLRYDDASVTPVHIQQVLQDPAYVLFYKQL